MLDSAMTSDPPASNEMAMTSDPPVRNEMASLLKDALSQQAAQFEAIMVDRLKTELAKVGLGGPEKQPESSQARKPINERIPTRTSSSKSLPAQVKQGHRRVTLPLAASQAALTSTPPPRKASRQITSQTSRAPPRTPAPGPTRTPGSNRKLHPLQLKASDLPDDFKQMKEALYIHIKMLWGLLLPNDVPAPPDERLLQEFYKQFSTAEEVEKVLNNPTAGDLIAQQDIITLRSARTGRSKIAKGLVNLDETYILYMHGLMAKVAMTVWGPDLNSSPDSLYNSACRILALKSFRELIASGAYNYMNVNLKYTDSMSLLIKAYNHYVHFVMATRFKTESKQPGRTKALNEKKKNQKNRERLRDSRIEFLFANRNKYPARYRKAMDDVLAHSDDEYNASSDVFVIKTLGYRSKNTNKFVRQLDVAMLKGSQLNGTVGRRRGRKLPKVPQPSNFTKIPKRLPIDFYDPTWFKNLEPNQQARLVNIHEVAFLPDASKSLLAGHPDEKLGDKTFNAKYYDIITEPYGLVPENEDVESDGEEASDDNEAIEVDDEEEQEEDVDSEFYSEGEYGDLYTEDQDHLHQDDF